MVGIVALHPVTEESGRHFEMRHAILQARQPKGFRLLVRVATVEGLTSEATPSLVRVRAAFDSAQGGGAQGLPENDKVIDGKKCHTQNCNTHIA